MAGQRRDLCCLNGYPKENSREYGRIRHLFLAIIGDRDRVISNGIHILALNWQAFPQQEKVNKKCAGADALTENQAIKWP